MFLVKCMKDTGEDLDISSYMSFVYSCTRATSTTKLKHNFNHFTTSRHFYFNRVIHIWNAIPFFDISQFYSSLNHQIVSFLWDHFIVHFKLTLIPHALLISTVHAPHVLIYPIFDSYKNNIVIHIWLHHLLWC